jgi:hypothetical protein
MSKTKTSDSTFTDELLKKLLIVELAIAGVPQREIGKIVGISLGAVNRIAKYVKVSRIDDNLKKSKQ